MGTTSNENVNTRVQELYGQLTEFHTKAGISNIPKREAAVRYMSITEVEMRAMSSEDCIEAAASLGQLAFNIQQEYAKNKSLAGKINHAVKSMVASEVGRMVGYSYEERRIKAIKDNDITRELDKLASDHTMKADSLEYLAKHIEYVAGTFTEMSKAKRGRHA